VGGERERGRERQGASGEERCREAVVAGAWKERSRKVCKKSENSVHGGREVEE